MTSPETQNREAFFDNARFLLVTLVVIGHALRPFISDPGPARAAYTWVYLFHMPALVFVSGVFSKRLVADAGGLRRLILRVAVPYFIFETAYSLFAYLALGRDDLVFAYQMPYFLMWFLMSLFLWRATLPLVVRLRAPMLVLVGAGLLIGYVRVDLDVWAASRTVVLYPFFLLGYYFDPAWVSRVRAERMMTPALVTLGAAFMGTMSLSGDIPLTFMYQNENYHDAGFYGLVGPGQRVLFYLGALVVGASFLALVPRGRTRFTRLGTRTLYVYLTHYFFTKVFVASGLWEHFQGPPGVIAVLLASVGLTLLLASDPVVRLLRPLVEPESLARAVKRRPQVV